MNQHEDDEARGEGEEHERGAIEDLAHPIEEVLQIVADQTRTHPVRTLGAAFGIGWVLGGGVPSFAMRLLGIAVMRSAATMVDWDAIAESALGMAGAGAPARARRPRRDHDGHGERGRTHH